MVFFNCNACGEALKKSAVEKHYMTKCRQCEVLSCVDCGKDFWGNDYQKHVKCISEEEKYSGKDYKPKENANKGEKKQELWIQQVQEAIQKASGNANLRNILQKLVDYPNIPRKQAKFENFLKNSLRVYNPNLCRQVWEAMSRCMNKPEAPSDSSVSHSSEKSQSTNGGENGNYEAKFSNKDYKEDSNTRTLEAETKEKSKKKKRKLGEVENGDAIDDEAKLKKSKKKKKSTDEDEHVAQQNGHQEHVDELPLVVGASTPGKFRFESTIASILGKREDKELSMKKLRKKVLNEYHFQVAESARLSEEKFWSKFDKKINKSDRFEVRNERVKLV